METFKKGKEGINKTAAANGAKTTYAILLRKLILNLVTRNILLFSLFVTVTFWLFGNYFTELSNNVPGFYGKLIFFVLVYLFIQAGLTAYTLKKHVVNPLKEFIDAAQILAEGGEEVKSDLIRSNEFFNLNDSFKFIKTELEDKDKRIEDYQKSLEQLIDDRTSDLKQALKRAQSTTEAKSEFFANITHELRTPLNGILGMTDLILDSELNLDQRSQLELVRESGNNLLSLVDDFLEYSKIEAGKMTLYKENLDLRKLINRSLLVLSIKAEQKGITIVHKIEDNVPNFIVSDNLRIKQILQNLISNSIKFSNNCGAIIVWIGVESIDGEDIQLHIGVSDAGIGIPKEKLELIFENLQDKKVIPSAKTISSGLGLSICKEIVTLMNGKIWAKSKEGIGTAIHFTMACKESTSTRDLSSDNIMVSALDTDRPAEKKKRILVCEDNPVNAKLVKALIEKAGHDVSVVENGEKALYQLQTEKFDLILMDCQMPQMDGFETTAYIRKKKTVKDPNIPIIALTANASPEDMERCFQCGMNAFITKPIEKSKFYEILNSFLPPQL